MNKTEFLEILKDYLKNNFSQDEVNDILRDYEEYFVNGLIEGKSDMEIISALGSPKTISRELLGQMKENNEKELSRRDIISDKFEKIKVRTKEKYIKIKRYISDKLTPDLYNEGKSISRDLIKIILIALSLFLIIPSFSLAIMLISTGAGLVTSLIAFIVGVPFILKFIWTTPEVASLLIFISIGFIGVQILAWEIYIFILRFCKDLIKNYINWLKTRNIYINASEKKEKLKKEKFYKNDEIIDREGEDKNE
ncbi:DUF1700 domain-containing protein [Romboutsia maritimum]|uniref:DUF1700 domain-containing protein n=1 Tax=Romboutsia maritimum TaxID=2020948 RepID=UPI001314CB29|nr:DUF1700 domain-containing protein [Romboutsia maritimum]